MDNNRSSWGSNLGFLLAAIGSAVGLGNIWGFPYKMGKSGGFTFLIVYLFLAIFVGMIIMVSELAVGRKTKLSPIDAYQKVTKKFAWIGWLATIAPFLIMSFYTVLGGYCLQYIALNMTKLSFGNEAVAMSGGDVFGAMLTTPLGCVVFTILFIIICMVIVQGGVSGGIEKFNKVGMPALFVMLLIIIVRSLTLPNASEGLKFMFVPGYAVSAGFIDQAPDLITVLGTAGGQMFFSLSLAMGAILTYGSYLSKEENLVKNSVIIVAADTLIALMAGIAVIPAAVSYGLSQGMAPGEITLRGPGLLFITLQDVFSNMGALGPLFGVIFYVLVLIAAISSAISLMETIAAHWIDKDLAKGETDTRQRNVLIVSLLILVGDASRRHADGSDDRLGEHPRSGSGRSRPRRSVCGLQSLLSCLREVRRSHRDGLRSGRSDDRLLRRRQCHLVHRCLRSAGCLLDLRSSRKENRVNLSRCVI